MAECCDIPSRISICQFPTELIIHIFKFLPGTTLMTCRRVSRRWKEVIDDMSCDEIMWENYCKREFEDLYEEAKYKSYSCRLWFEVYRSLSVWNRLQYATETRKNVHHSEIMEYMTQVEDMQMLKNGILALNTCKSIDYYDISTLELSGRESVQGDYKKYYEYDETLLVQHNSIAVTLVKLPKEMDDSMNSRPKQISFDNIRLIAKFKKIVYIVHINDNINYCNIDDLVVNEKQPPPNKETPGAVGMYDGVFHVLTTNGKVYKYVDKAPEIVCTIDDVKDHLFDFLWRYKFIENIDWRYFHHWVQSHRVILPENPLRYVCLVKAYGDVFFVGNKSGRLMIFYKPYVDGRLDFFAHRPVKHFHFGKGDFLPMLSLDPILKVEVVEIKEGHRVIVALTNDVITLTYTHNFEEGDNQEIIPCVTPPLIP